MKIKRIFAKDMRSAMRRVREELGADAVILSNAPVKGGIEIVAAVDYDASLFATESNDIPVEVAVVPGRAPSAVRPDRDTAIAGVDALPTTPQTKESSKQPAWAAGIAWEQDPALVEMRGELRYLRALLEQQLSGLAWGDLARRHPLKAKVIRQLVDLDIHPDICRRVTDAVADYADFDTAWRHALAMLAHQLRVADDLLARGGTFALVGPTGVGKTTTIAKLAARYALAHGRNRVGLISTDSYRIGAHEQLRTFGRILEIPMRVASTRDELKEAIQVFADKDLVLIDTAGMSQRDMRLTEQFLMLTDAAPALQTVMVLSATTQRVAVGEILQSFRRTPLAACIVTKLDEATNLGGAVSELIRCQLPVAYISDGQRVPEDIQPARAHTLVSRSVAMAQKSGPLVDDESLEYTYHRMMANAHG